MGERDKKIIQDIFSKDRWVVPLERFIQVLRINIFVVDAQGNPIIHPCATSRGEEYGCRIITHTLGLAEPQSEDDFLKNFTAFGAYYEYHSPVGMHAFAMPLTMYDKTVAYMVLGPVIVGKRLEDQEYVDLANEGGVDPNALLNELSGVRTVSYLTITSVLDLLAAIARDFIDIGLENRRLKRANKQTDFSPSAIVQAAEGMYRQIHSDEVLESVLEVALKMTRADVGSIMVLDRDSHEMMVRVSCGLSEEWVKNARVKMGEGVAGKAAQNNQYYIMRGQEADDEIKPFLKRPDIKEAIAMPITHNNHILGVMNLHSKKDGSRIEDNFGSLMSLSKLLSTAIAY